MSISANQTHIWEYIKLFFPKMQELIDNLELQDSDIKSYLPFSDNLLRYVYTDPRHPLLREERQAVKKMKDYLSENEDDIKFKEKMEETNNAELLRFYYGVEGNIELAVKAFRDAVIGLIEEGTMSQSQKDHENTMIGEILKAVPFYCNSRDDALRPIIVVNVSKV